MLAVYLTKTNTSTALPPNVCNTDRACRHMMICCLSRSASVDW